MRGSTLLLVLVLAVTARADLASTLQRTLKRPDAGARVAGLQDARAELLGTDRRGRNKAAATLSKALHREPDPRVRRAVFDFLLLLRTERALDLLVAGVLDRNPAVAAHVHALVRDHADPMLHDAIVRALGTDESWRFRARLVDLLLSGAREAAKAPLVDALSDAHPAVRAHAA